MQRCMFCEAEVPEGGTCCKNSPLQPLDSDRSQVLDEDFFEHDALEDFKEDILTMEPVHEMTADNGL